MIRKVTFYWLLLTLVLIDAWLLSKPNLLGKIGLVIYKYHYLRSFPRTLLTVWIVISISVLIVLLIQYLKRQEKLSRGVASAILAAFAIASLLILAQVYVDFASWSYSHTGMKFRYGAYLLPALMVFVFLNGLAGLYITRKSPDVVSDSQTVDTSETDQIISRDTSLPLRP
jgi:hypothetical protein